MKDYIVKHPWKIIEDGFNAENNRISESLFSIGNGKWGQRGNFEETYSGDSLEGNYVGGIYYPDKTRVGWWKNGYPEYFAKVLNATSWFDLDISFGKEQLDLRNAEITSFTRELDFRDGVLIREVEANLKKVKNIKISSAKFISKADSELAVLHYRISADKYKGKLKIKSIINGDVHNEDANYDEQFWEPVSEFSKKRDTMVVNKTRKTGFIIGTAARTLIYINGNEWRGKVKNKTSFMSASLTGNLKLKKGDVVDIFKYVSVVSSRYRKRRKIGKIALKNIEIAAGIGWNQHLTNQRAAWLDVWEHGDIEIQGDIAAQQGIRFCIFQMYQTYDGSDSRLNIGPKGFTGEKYGGSTYWDTEAYCLPFYMFTAGTDIARNLLLYRYDHLENAIKNAEKLGFHSGAALYPMVTMNGEECHNEWEITFEEIHRNGAIAYAIYDYVNTTGDQAYIHMYGIKVLIAIARFWVQRVNWSEEKQKFVMLGVTGPNEYENNVNNNWYTNYIARWCLKYTTEIVERIENENKELFGQILEILHLSDGEFNNWKHIAENIYLPYHHDLGIFLQQDGFMDKEIKPVTELSEHDIPINQNWSWDRILRSCYIKQADVLQGLYFFENDFDLETIRRNYEFYEPLTVHESSLSPCVHAILASRLGNIEDAYRKLVRTARLDLDDINNDTEDGCHITSMAGSWMALVKGLGGMRVVKGELNLSPSIPEHWDGYNFSLRISDHIIHVNVMREKVTLINVEGEGEFLLNIYNHTVTIPENDRIEINR